MRAARAVNLLCRLSATRCRKLFRANLHGGAGFVICYFQAEGSDRLFGTARDWVCLLRGIGVQEYEWRGCLCRVLMR